MSRRFTVTMLVLSLLVGVVFASRLTARADGVRPSGRAGALAPAAGRPAAAARLTAEAFLSPAYPYELVSAAKADRLAWLSYEKGRRNVYTAAAPDFKPVQLTRFMEDDGVDLSNLNISDDGSVVVFVRGHTPNRDGWVANPTHDPDGARRVIWAAQTTGGSPWPLVEGTTPVLSPDGRFVAFVKDGQIYRVPVSRTPGATPTDRGEKPFITAWGENANPRWSPDGTKIAFVSNRGDHSFVAVYDAKTHRVRYMAPSVDYDSSPTWSPDGTQIAFIRRPGAPFGVQIQMQAAGQTGRGRGRGVPGPTFGFGQRGRGEGGGPAIPGLTQATFAGGYGLSFWVADVATGEGREVWHDLPGSDTFSRVTSIRWAGDHLVFSAEPEEWVRYYAVRASGGTTEPIVLTPEDGMVEQVGFSADGRTLYYATNAGDIDRRHVWKVSTAGGPSVQLTRGDGIETYPVALASGQLVALFSAGARQPQSVAVVPATGGAPKVLFPTLPAEFPLAEHVVPENVTLKAEDGVEFHNQLFLPKDLKPGERRPAMVFVHGGPVRQMLLGYHYMHFYHMAYAINQWLVSQGYIVLSVNFRSGIGYGRSFRMAENTGQRGNAEYRDVLAAGRYLQGRPDVDPKRIGIWGLSYGGILTAQALARNSDIFAAGVDLAGIHLWGNSIDPSSVSYQSSSISAIDTWKSPVLLVHGDDDRNVAFSQTTGLVQLLRARNIYHELIVFPDDVHESLLFSRWLYTLDRMEAFLRRFVKGEAATTSGPGADGEGRDGGRAARGSR
jgi:dipeptidyl-peptidase-4